MHPQEAIAWAFLRTPPQVSTHHRIVPERHSTWGVARMGHAQPAPSAICVPGAQYRRWLRAAFDTKRSVRVETDPRGRGRQAHYVIEEDGRPLVPMRRANNK
jgi:hypothetical protein